MKFNKLIVSSLVLLTFFSCKKVLDVRETDFIGGDIALKTVANNEQGIIGAYGRLGIEMSILFSAIVSDEAKKAEFYSFGTVHEWQYTSNDVPIRDNFTAYNTYYRVIDVTNRVLQALPTADSMKAGDNALRSRLRGEALFLRAFSHFEASRFYAGSYDANALALPYLERSTLEPQARLTMGPFYTKLIADITEAKTLLPNNLTDITRANRLAAVGLHARVALYMKDWATAISNATEYNNALPLATRAQFPGLWTDANSAEVAFKLKRTNAQSGVLNYSPQTVVLSTSRMGSLFRATSASTSNIGTVSWVPTDEIWASYDQANDIRFPSYFKDEPLLTTAGRPSRVIAKYAGTGYGTPGENVADAKVFRTAEMYLIRAEARAESNDLLGAAADLNALRTARITGYTPEIFATKDAVISAIIQERFKELAYEGHRFFDLRRRNLPVERLASDAPASTAAVLPAGNFRFVLPIPNHEIQANNLMEQNPGYTN